MSVRVARVGKPHGVRGEVTLRLYTDDPRARFAPGSSLSVRPAQGGDDAAAPSALTVAGARWNKNVLVARFAEVTDRNGAEALRGSELYAQVDPEEHAQDEWRQDELVGLVAVDTTRGDEVVGAVTALLTGPAQDLLEIEVTGGRRVLVPFVEQIVPEVDVAAGRVLLVPPPGLLELGE